MEVKKEKILYKIIYDTLIQRIKKGIYKSGDKIPTEKEWCKEFNVSRITVKSALNLAAKHKIIYRKPGRGSFISEKIIDHLKYMVPSKKKTVGVIFPEISNFFGAQCYAHIESLLHDNDIFLLTGISNKNIEKEKALIKRFYNYGVDGFIILPVHYETFNEEILKLILNNFPVVLIDRYLKDVECTNVISDNIKASYDGIHYLSKLGHKNIGIISRPIQAGSSLEDREKGVTQAITKIKKFEKQNITWLTSLSKLNNKDETQFLEHKNIIKNFLIKNNNITALFTFEYAPVPIIENVTQELKINIPKDLSILCFDAPSYLIHQTHPVSYLKQNEALIAQQAFNLLTLMFQNNKRQHSQIKIPVELITGTTTASPTY